MKNIEWSTQIIFWKVSQKLYLFPDIKPVPRWKKSPYIVIFCDCDNINN